MFAYRKALFVAGFLLTACKPPTEADSVDIGQDSPAASTTASAIAPVASAATPSNDAPGDGAAAKPNDTSGQVKKLDSLAALKDAQAKGLKISLIVPYPTPCPTIAKPKGDPTLLKAKGKLAGTIVDMEGFLRADMGVPEAVALLGDPVLCNGGAVPGYLDMFLAPRDPAVRSVTLETHDGDLIGIVVEYEKPTPVDITDLEKQYGKPRKFPGPHDSFEAGSNVFDKDGSAYRAHFSFARKSHSDPPNAHQVHQIIFRRTSMIEILPDGFQSPSDVARLVAMALQSKVPDAVSFAGTLGTYSPPVNLRISFGPAIPVRNVSNASIVLRNETERQRLAMLEVTFKAPIAGDVKKFAEAMANLLNLPVPTITDDGKRKRLDFANGAEKRGQVFLDWSGGNLKAIQVIRADVDK